MKSMKVLLLASVISFSAGIAFAQPGAGKGSGPGAGPMGGPAASAPAAGPGPGAGPGMARSGSDYTSGWALMSQQERNEHRDRIRAMKTYEECHAYQVQHHEQMAVRAKERGGKALSQPRRDACAGLKK